MIAPRMGPFANLDAAQGYVDKEQANPGAYTTDASGTQARPAEVINPDELRAKAVHFWW